MCGIAGYHGTIDLPQERITATLDLMRRRGPDHAAHRRWVTATGKNVYFLHSRLSIIDLEPRSNQPFNVGQKWITYNGELYNYLELRDELTSLGHTLRTRSDTEVLLRTIDHYGWSALDKCEGMWAFAVYDEAECSLTLCRDRFGEKPLYVYKDSSGLYFGSEVKFIVSLLGRRLDVNYDHLYRYMVNGYKALYKDGHNFFMGLSELEPGHLLRVGDNASKHLEKYWFPTYEIDPSMSYEDAVAGVRERLIRSMELRLRSDVPLAFCMSGGVDSNSLISVAKNVFGYDVHGFTILNSDARYEEQDMVDHAVSLLGINHTGIPVDTAGFLGKLRTLIRYHDAPVYTISYYAHWLLMDSVAKAGYRIAVSGTAADELFTGYFDHHMFYLHEVKGIPDLLDRSLESWRTHVKPLIRNPYLQDPELFLGNPHFRDHIFLDSKDFSSYLASQWMEPFSERLFTKSMLRNRMLNEVFHEVVPVILHEDDLNAMYFSIENRSPYLDRNLFEFSFTIPSKHLVRNGRTKSVLRDAMRGIVPDRILDNYRKVGFNAPILSFLDTRDPDVRACLLDDSPIFDHVRRDKIECLIGETHLPNSKSKFLFYFLCSKMFLEEFRTH